MPETGSDTRTQDMRVLLQRFIEEVINGRDLDLAMKDIVAEDFVEQIPFPGQGPGRAGLAEVLAGLFAAFPDLHWTIRDTLAEDDRIMAYSTWTGTHRGEFMGIPATGHRVSVDAWTIDRYRNGQMTESRLIMDVAGLLTQLGVLPAPTVS
ncbi:ester cyclase [Rhodococcoides yunnanense]|uniref:ester cyclase n=1 Tax=Rhodococcoides yunnanense TaxID=278209 RepID=UPI0009FD77F2|nr:ester cyclase [Rhodococcus yunnanensis]